MHRFRTMRREEVITLRLDRDLMGRIQDVAKKEKVTPQEVFRTAGREFVDKQSMRAMLENIQKSLRELKEARGQ